MKLKVTFKQPITEHQRDLAEKINSGEKSFLVQNNKLKVIFRIHGNISRFSLLENSDLRLRYSDIGEVIIPNMTILECFDGGLIKGGYAASTSLIQRISKKYNKKYDIAEISLYFYSHKEFVKLSPTIFVLDEELPDYFNPPPQKDNWLIIPASEE